VKLIDLQSRFGTEEESRLHVEPLRWPLPRGRDLARTPVLVERKGKPKAEELERHSARDIAPKVLCWIDLHRVVLRTDKLPASAGSGAK
jgi:hypothetical protein